MTKRFIGLIQPPASENLTEVSLSKTCDGDSDVPELPSDPLQRRIEFNLTFVTTK